MNDATARTSPEFQAPSGPAAMTRTSLGTIFLYDLADGDISRYRQSREGTAAERARRLLGRIASKSSAGAGDNRPTLSPQEVSSLTTPEVEALFEVYLGSPRNQWFYTKAREASNGVVRSKGESAVAFFDRLLEWYATFHHAGANAAPRGQAAESAPTARAAGIYETSDEAPREFLGKFASSVEASLAATRKSLAWALGGLILAMVAVAGFAAWMGFQAHVRDREDAAKTEAWQQQMKILAENNSAMERAFTEMASENARLKARIETLERRPGASAKTGASPPPRKVPAPGKPSRPPARK